MNGSLPLAGRRIGITRPLTQAAGLAEGVRRGGGEPLLLPLQVIAPLADASELAAAAAALAEYDLLVFVSANAVAHALPAVLAWRPERLPLMVAPGPGTATAIRQLAPDARIVVPAARFDSESMLALPALQAVAGWRVALFRGNGGRELLGDTLAARGAVVNRIACYQRLPADGGALRAALADGLDALTLTSSEAARHLAGLCAGGLPLPVDLPVFVTHTRVEAAAIDAGLRRVTRTPPGDAALLHGMMAFFRRA